jgi:hypothetical protein
VVLMLWGNVVGHTALIKRAPETSGVDVSLCIWIARRPR